MNKNYEHLVIKFMQQETYLPMKQHELAKALEFFTPDEKNQLRQTLQELAERGQLEKLRKNRWALKDRRYQVEGRLQFLSNGAGLIIPDDPKDSAVYVKEKNLQRAFPGDRVIGELFYRGNGRGDRDSSSNEEREGRVVTIVERRIEQVVGTIQKARYGFFLRVEEPAFPYPVWIDNPEKGKAHHKVVVKLHPWDDSHQPVRGSIIETLGASYEPGIEIDALLKAAQIEQHFPTDVMREVEELEASISDEEIKRRVDLRDKLVFTIDPETARDFDDAISLEAHPDGGWQLGVHIADVAHFVQPGSSIDREAYKRANSIYLVDRVIMMLPEELTTQLCSLNPHADHLAHSVLLHLSQEGDLIGYETFPSIIHSKTRLTYHEVQAYMNTQKSSPALHDDVRETLDQLIPLIQSVRKKRVDHGSLELNTPDIEIKLDGSGKVLSIKPRSEAREAYQLIEDCMLLANQAVAEKIQTAEQSSLYRIHEEPDEEQWNKMAMELSAMGIPHLPQSKEELNQIFRLAENRPNAYAILLTVLKNLKRAEYAAYCAPHFGLGFESYTHFTSPIRRYSDLIVHRILKCLEQTESPTYSADKLIEIAAHCSDQERIADELSKKSTEKKRLQYYHDLLMKHKIASFNAHIVAIKPSGLIVEIPESLQRGRVAFKSIKQEWLEADASGTHACTQSGKVRYTLGETIEVLIERVDLDRGFIDFLLPNENKKNRSSDKKRYKTDIDLRTGRKKHRRRRKK